MGKGMSGFLVDKKNLCSLYSEVAFHSLAKYLASSSYSIKIVE
jgi:hypothetical protein